MSEADPHQSRPTFTAIERRQIVENDGTSGAVPCPRCGQPLASQDVRGDPAVSYVRHRQMWSCTGCGASTAIDRRR